MGAKVSGFCMLLQGCFVQFYYGLLIFNVSSYSSDITQSEHSEGKYLKCCVVFIQDHFFGKCL